ncbi:caspase, EACC1-associated type [Streptomyces naphthomycinicus]|uniref:caspase, EACC1-associated type n=1 Tax=Streptomyces naphthomycinicus TaxID=2872625 RepID=UPI001CEDA145|nr:PQQ-binding-like beta-propeller repeat protein [Streptomyces sp. TML10]
MNAGAPRPSDSGHTRVLLVGTSRFAKLTDLPAVENNLEALREVLTHSSWGLPEENCVTLLNEPDKATVIGALKRAADARDTVIFYYAGHGLVDAKYTDQLLLALPESSADDWEHCLRYDEVARALTFVRARRKVVILDCCFAGRAKALGDSGKASDAGYVLCAAGPTKEARSPEGTRYTGFTAALLEILYNGIPGKGPFLDMYTIYNRLAEQLRDGPLPKPTQFTTADGGSIAFVVNQAHGTAGTVRRRVFGQAVRPWPARRRLLAIGVGVAAVGAGAGFLLHDRLTDEGTTAEPPGKERWSRHFSAAALVFAGDRTLFTALQDGRVTGLRPTDGEPMWETDLRGSLTRSSLVKGTALISLSDGRHKGTLNAVDGTGRKRWTLSTNGWPWHQAEGRDDEIYTVTTDGWLYRIDLATGRTGFAQKISDGQLNEVAVAGNLLYVSTYREGIIALDPVRGTPVWTHRTKGFVAGAAVDAERVYLTVGHGTDPSSFGGQLLALDALEGKTRWSHTFTTLLQAGPTLAAGRVLLTDLRGTLHAFRASDGQRTWQQDVSADSSNRVGYDGETVYAGTDRGVTALNLNTGDVRWTGEVVADPPTSRYSSAEPAVDAHSVYIAYGDRTTSGDNCDIHAFSR